MGEILTFVVTLNTIACVRFALGGAFIPMRRESCFPGGPLAEVSM